MIREGSSKKNYHPEFLAFAEAVSQSQNLEEIYVCGETINLSKFRSDTVIVLKEESILKNEKRSLSEDFAIISRCIAQNENLKKIGFQSMIKLNAKVEKLILSAFLIFFSFKFPVVFLSLSFRFLFPVSAGMYHYPQTFWCVPYFCLHVQNPF